MMLTTPMRFMIIDEEKARHDNMHQFRENICQAYASLRLSVLKKISQVAACAGKMENIDHEAIAERYGQVRFASNSEAMTAPFVKTALLVQKHMLSNNAIKDIGW